VATESVAVSQIILETNAYTNNTSSI